MKLILSSGTTSKIVGLFIQDSSKTDGSGLTGLAYNTSGLKAYYHREGGTSATAITLATMTVGTWASGGFVEVDATNMPGYYLLGLPNAVLASGANSARVMLSGAANMVPVVIEIQTGVPVTASTVSDKTGYSISGTIQTLDALKTAGDAAWAASAPSDSGTAQAGAAGSLTLKAGASASDIYTNQALVLTGGTGAGQARLITAYNTGTKVASVSPNWTITPDNTTTYMIVPALAYIAGVSSGAVATIQNGLATGAALTGVGDNVSAILADTGTDGVVVAGASITTIQSGLATSAAQTTLQSTVNALTTPITRLRQWAENRKTQTADTLTLYADDDTTPLATKSVADDGTTVDLGAAADV